MRWARCRVLEHKGPGARSERVILDYLAEVARVFGACDAEERREILRWTLFDNH